MLTHFKRIALFSLVLFMGLTLSAQLEDFIVYSETDSMQDIKLEKLEAQFNAVKSMLWKTSKEQQELTDSLELVNSEQAEQIMILVEESENMEKMLKLVEAEISHNDHQVQESRKKFKRVLFITLPSLLFITIALSTLLYILVSKYRSSTYLQINALRKYTVEGIEEVRLDYVNEIKKRIKKVSAKFKMSGKKGKEKKRSKKVKGTGAKRSSVRPKADPKRKK